MGKSVEEANIFLQYFDRFTTHFIHDMDSRLGFSALSAIFGVVQKDEDYVILAAISVVNALVVGQLLKSGAVAVLGKTNPLVYRPQGSFDRSWGMPSSHSFSGAFMSGFLYKKFQQELKNGREKKESVEIRVVMYVLLWFAIIYERLANHTVLQFVVGAIIGVFAGYYTYELVRRAKLGGIPSQFGGALKEYPRFLGDE